MSVAVDVAWGASQDRRSELGPIRVSELAFAPLSNLPGHEHDRPTLAIVIRGLMEATLDGSRVDCPVGTLRSEPAGVRHANRFGPAGARVVIIQPDPTAVALAPATGRLTDIAHFRDPQIASLGTAVARELRYPDTVSAIALDGLALDILAAAARMARRSADVGPPIVGQAVELLHESFRAPVRLHALATQLGVEPDRLARAFRATEGCSVATYVRRLRLEWVAHRLATSVDPIATLAQEAGFADQAHLSRLFRAAFGVTPRRFRAIARS
ncbi:MAG TPA: AraC family transcriptional regulator [Candidatus Limnocylindria bacterium]